MIDKECIVTESRSSRTPPGLVILLTSVVALLVLLGVYYEWWPLGDMTNDRKLLVAAPALLILAASGLGWLIKLVKFVASEHRGSWWNAAAPAAIAAGIAVMMVFPPAGFEDARPQLERIAQEIIDSPNSTQSDIGVGGVDNSRVERRADGGVYFIEADHSFGSTRGWIYSPGHAPDGTRVFLSLNSIGGSWYQFEYGS
ncbi:hypothetical protein RQCS_62430 (plasmid) [Rhodococcus qingshengii]|uniref:hypothetical protein n=1 Tax=Rhodococcus qingshengii TaxID=334542 RepID=UPI0007E5767C|nr:hypothetical protein [Rhodococcus qingshengii]BCF86698.1 hypothetical protein RQCS_62430 [Rhodococcus qingshengii]